MRYAGMGLELGAAIIGLTLAGLWVDHEFDTGSIGVTVGASIGIVGGMYNFIRQALGMMKTHKPDPTNEQPAQDDERTRHT